jgi:prophage antirepressor-like protein
MVRYELQGEKIVIDGEELTVIYFADKPDEPWFKAKPVHNFLGSANINQTMARVHDDDKGHLKDLVAAKGEPFVGVVMSDITTPNHTDYHEGKAWYVNESGLYCIVMGSEKAVAKGFQRWVTSEVLPSIRRRGYYTGENPLLAAEEIAERGRKRSFDEMHGAVLVLSKEVVEQRVVLKSLTEAIQKIQESQAATLVELKESQAATLAKVLASINGFAGQLALPVVLAVNRLEARLLASLAGALAGALASQTLSLCGHLRGVVDASLLAPGGAFVRALRDAVRPPSRRASPRESSFPSGQKRGDAERALEPWINLTALVDRELRAERAARGLPADPLCYGAWRAERSRLGKALKRDRLRRHGLGPSHPDFCDRPLLWDRIAGGPAYVLHADEERHVARVLRSGAPSALDRLLWAPPSQDPWPLNRDDLVYGYDADEGDEDGDDGERDCRRDCRREG